MKAPNPFSLDTTSYTLQPDEAATIAVSFDPDFKHDMQSQLVKHKLSISYSDNPQKDSLELVGSIEFPNLQLEAQQLDFGCVLMDTTRRLSLGLTNPRKAHVNYSWAWLKQEFSDPGTLPQAVLLLWCGLVCQMLCYSKYHQLRSTYGHEW